MQTKKTNEINEQISNYLELKYNFSTLSNQDRSKYLFIESQYRIINECILNIQSLATTSKQIEELGDNTLQSVVIDFGNMRIILDHNSPKFTLTLKH